MGNIVKVGDRCNLHTHGDTCGICGYGIIDEDDTYGSDTYVADADDDTDTDNVTHVFVWPMDEGDSDFAGYSD